jgi:hypothetical protein
MSEQSLRGFDHAARDFEEYMAGPGEWLLG